MLLPFGVLFANYLVILSLNLEVALWVVANWANLWSLLAYYDVTAVRALPDAIAITRENYLVLNVLQELAITLLVVLLNLSYHLELSGNLVEALLTSLFSHAFVHLCPLAMLTLGSSQKVLFCTLDGTALQVLEPQLSVLLLVGSSLLEDVSYLNITILLSLACEVCIFITSH